MEKIGEFLEVLIIAEITDTITGQEKDLLHRIIAINPKARELYEEVHAYLASEDVTNAISELPQAIQVSDMIGEPSSKLRKIMRLQTAMGFSVISIFCFYGYFFAIFTHILPTIEII